MGSRDPSLISDPEDRKWVVGISQLVNHQFKIDSATPSVSLFQVPKTITATKPEAYEPQQIGLGPIHHFQPQPYKKKEQKKLAVMRNFFLFFVYEITYSKICRAYVPFLSVFDADDSDFRNRNLTSVLESLRKVVPAVRSCYDIFLQEGDEHLAWIFAIDGVFLLDLFKSYNRIREETNSEYKIKLQNKACELMQSEGISFDSLTKGKLWSWETIEIYRNEETTEWKLVLILDDKNVWSNEFSFPTFHPPLPKIGPKKRSEEKEILCGFDPDPVEVKHTLG